MKKIRSRKNARNDVRNARKKKSVEDAYAAVARIILANDKFKRAKSMKELLP